MSTIPDPVHAALSALSEGLAGLRKAGWFSAVPPEEWHTLSGLLSLPRHGNSVSFTPDQAAYVLGTDEAEAARRLDSLSRFEWQGRALLALERDAYGALAGATLPEIVVDDRDRLPPDAAAASSPRSSSGVSLRLEEAGLYADQVERLLAEYPEERIRRQLDWLPARKARVPAALLLRAVEGDWGPPKEAKPPDNEPTDSP
jgi:hypothetical protein